MLKLITFTDESGQDTKGELFIVCSIVIDSDNEEILNKKLEEVEMQSKKEKKWAKSDNKRRYTYIAQIAKNLSEIHAYFSFYRNTNEYIDCVSLHIARMLQFHTNTNEYSVRITLDTQSLNDRRKITKYLKQYGIRFRNIKSIRDESSSFIRLADALCGMLRDSIEIKSPKLYKKVKKMLVEV